MMAFLSNLPSTLRAGCKPKQCVCSRGKWGTKVYVGRNGPFCTTTANKRGQTVLFPHASAASRERVIRDSEAKGVSREVTDKALSAAERVIRNWTATVTDFVTPPESEALLSSLRGLADLRVEAWGGYEQAERKVLALARADIVENNSAIHELVKKELVCLQIKGNFLFDPASHRDFLGALLGAGVTRQKVGDIIVLGDRGCQTIVSKDVAEFLSVSVTSVRSVPVKIERIDWGLLEVRAPSVKEMNIVEASMRLDAVASAGFSMSRSKFAEMVRAGDCQINYKQATSPAKLLKTSDVVSLRGKGKLEVGETSLTSKGRHRVQITRYV